jgi:hypothetical protein
MEDERPTDVGGEETDADEDDVRDDEPAGPSALTTVE